jgi:hypothetical protein
MPMGGWPGIKHNEEVLFSCTILKKTVGVYKSMPDKYLVNKSRLCMHFTPVSSVIDWQAVDTQAL